MQKEGFTLIELLVVVLIIAILAAVALPQYQRAVKKSHGAEALTAIDALDKALTSYYLEHGTYQDAGPDTFQVTIPELKHFRFSVGSFDQYTSYEESSQSFEKEHLDGSVYGSGRGCSTNGCRITLTAPNDEIKVTGEWKNGKLTTIECLPNGSSPSCIDYFNCERTWHPQTSSTINGEVVINPGYYSNNCILK